MKLLSIAALALATTMPAAAGAAPDLAEVRELYASASYEEALAALETLKVPDQAELVEQFRALCLLGLGRNMEAERSVERIVASKPLYSVPDDASPRLVTLFKDVRKRTLPAAARQVYARAKTSYDGKDFPAASAQFAEVLAILKHPDAAGHAASLDDLRQLAEGFRALSESAIASQKAAAAAALAAAAPQPAPAPPPVPTPKPVYSTTDAGISPPVAITRTLPGWKPTNPLLSQRTFRGMLEVIINEEGLVEWAALSKATIAAYDAALLAATKTWRFQPATRQGVPVRYQLALEIVLLPSSGAE
jgi:TonB family protein